MFKPFLYSVLVCTIFLLSCNSGKNSDTTETVQAVQSDTLTYTMEHYRIESNLERKATDTIKEKTFFEASFPIFQDSLINQYIQSLLIFNNDPDKPRFNTLEDAGKDFIKTFEDFQKLDYSSPWPWYCKINADVAENHASYLGITVNYEDFMGGAHGNHGTIFGNYNYQTKKKITLKDIILEGKMDSLTAIAKNIFIKQEGIDNKKNSFENYFFENEEFSLNNNFLLHESSLLFLYNIYEIKPYVDGITRLEIPYSKIKHLLSPQAKEILNINQ